MMPLPRVIRWSTNVSILKGNIHLETKLKIACMLNLVWLLVWLYSPRPIAFQSPLSMRCPSKSTGVGCHFLLWGIFPSQGLNSRLLWLLHCRQILYHWATGAWHLLIKKTSTVSPHLRVKFSINFLRTGQYLNNQLPNFLD